MDGCESNLVYESTRTARVMSIAPGTRSAFWNFSCLKYATAVLTTAMKSSMSAGCSLSAATCSRILAVFSGASSRSVALWLSANSSMQDEGTYAGSPSGPLTCRYIQEIPSNH